jgi:hypothetical protein
MTLAVQVPVRTMALLAPTPLFHVQNSSFRLPNESPLSPSPCQVERLVPSAHNEMNLHPCHPPEQAGVAAVSCHTHPHPEAPRAVVRLRLFCYADTTWAIPLVMVCGATSCKSSPDSVHLWIRKSDHRLHYWFVHAISTKSPADRAMQVPFT